VHSLVSHQNCPCYARFYRPGVIPVPRIQLCGELMPCLFELHMHRRLLVSPVPGAVVGPFSFPLDILDRGLAGTRWMGNPTGPGSIRPDPGLQLMEQISHSWPLREPRACGVGAERPCSALPSDPLERRRWRISSARPGPAPADPYRSDNRPHRGAGVWSDRPISPPLSRPSSAHPSSYRMARTIGATSIAPAVPRRAPATLHRCSLGCRSTKTPHRR